MYKLYIMNKKRTRSYEKDEPLNFRNEWCKRDKVRIITNDKEHRRLLFVYVCVNGHQPSDSKIESFHEDHHHIFRPMKMQKRQPRHTYRSYLGSADNVERWFTSINKFTRMLTCRHNDIRLDRPTGRHNYIRKNMLHSLRLFTVLLSIVSFSTTKNSMAWAWLAGNPTTSWNTYTTCYDNTHRELHTVQHNLFLYPVLKRRRCQELSSLFSSSNSYTSSDVQIINDHNTNNRDSDSNADNSTGKVLDSTTTTSDHLLDSMYRNDANDDNASLTNDSESFWVTTSQNIGNIDGMDDGDDDIPRLTENGGYSHTQASRAKISAANKGKVPWNKGVNRTDEVKARIAAGVRAKNRERHLQKLQEIGITEEEYEEQKRKERSAKEAERRARRTENGGYRPTDETKRKISEILKQKFAAGEIKPRPISPVHIRRGFKHSEETRQKISESLRKRWSSDPAYRARMVDVSNRVNTKEEVRQKISESLRNKWQTDDTFRNDMMSKIAARKRRVLNADTGTVEIVHHDAEHRAKISAAMKAKWQDKEYRERNLQSLVSRRTAPDEGSDDIAIAKSTNRLPIVPLTPKNASVLKSAKSTQETMPRQTFETTVKQKVPISKNTALITSNNKKEVSKAQISKNRSVKLDTDNADEAVLVRPVQPLTTPHKKVKKTGMQGTTSEKSRPDEDTTRHENRINSLNGGDKIGSHTQMVTPKSVVVKSDTSMDENDTEWNIKAETATTKKGAKSASPAASNGNVELLKAERRDLYDLLYGDDDDSDDGTIGNFTEDDDTSSTAHIHDDYDESTLTGSTTPTLASIFARLEDDNLDTFDPYGLDDF
jgi:NUMOD3 motif